MGCFTRRPGLARGSEVWNILTIDLEDWYHGIELTTNKRPKCEDRLERNLGFLLDILDNYETNATFFVLGEVAEKFPSLIREIHYLGHEIGTHGYSHEFVFKMSPRQFASDLSRSIDCLEQITGNHIRIYRAPYFSITEESIWATEILVEQGIEYDSSIPPIRNYRYGIPGAPGHIYNIRTQNGTLLEIPVSVLELFGRNFSLIGGFYLRFFPYYIIKRAIKRINDKGHPAVVYLHPWELDPDHPRLDLPMRISLTHYHNLKNTKKKLQTLLKDFEFTSAMSLASETLNVEHFRYLSLVSEKAGILWEPLG